MNSCMPVLCQEHNILVELCFLVSNRDFIAEALAVPMMEEQTLHPL